ncbi:MAG: UvrD-helicase domain-containing protein [Prevotellaceae bacterium]|jgi:DNA helicase-2/ATP-dependent DNA helicase PcrA|nr:UvrD-helicase domain-containing protein [Prevotellaceae bacterium]
MNFLDELSDVQREAVIHFQHPSLIIAGAGSGKTRVLTYRIAYLLQQDVRPQHVLALTFTNKAAREMKERIGALVGAEVTRRLWMGTFHAIFARILRSEAERLGYPRSFTIYDAGDSKSLVRACIKELGFDEKIYKPGHVSARISMAKNNLIRAGEYAANAQITTTDAACRMPLIADIYTLYERKCKLAGAMDFDDLLLNTNLLFRDFPEALAHYGSLFQYILVDEYQDTNYAQYLIVKKLAQSHHNICVVGDDAQSIYAFRGARIENILNFRNDYPDYQEYRLEENYRSTQTIVNAANSLIAKNSRQLRKKCFSRADAGEPIHVLSAFTEQEESFMVASSIFDTVYSKQTPYSEIAILYRTNAQSRPFEEALRKKNLPYKIYGGMSFYQRAEVKDLLAYLRLIVNPNDDEAFRRAVQTPSRGIGTTSLEHLQATAAAEEKSMYDTFLSLSPTAIGLRPQVAKKLQVFCALIAELSSLQFAIDAHELATEVAKRSGYIAELKETNSVENITRLEYVEELLNSIKEFCDNPDNAGPDEENRLITVRQYLENVSLLTDMDNEKEEDRNKVTLMTAHAAKGLEFSYVYITGMEETLFPSGLSTDSVEALEEERRLFYVALTRAKRRITVSFSKTRYRWGETVSNRPSRFLREIDANYFNKPIFGDTPKGKLPEGKGAFAGRRETGRKTPVRTMMKPVGMAVPRRAANFAPGDQPALAAGMIIEHDRFGKGKVASVEGVMPEAKAIVDFDNYGRKTLLLKYANINVLM